MSYLLGLPGLLALLGWPGMIAGRHALLTWRAGLRGLLAWPAWLGLPCLPDLACLRACLLGVPGLLSLLGLFNSQDCLACLARLLAWRAACVRAWFACLLAVHARLGLPALLSLLGSPGSLALLACLACVLA